MLNNSFTLVGTALTNFEKIDGQKYVIYKIKIAVEKRLGKGAGSEHVYTLKTTDRNTNVKFDGVFKDKLVVANGYVDVKNKDNGYDDYTLVLQDILVCSDIKPEVKDDGLPF